jgi:hypothetical protein
MMLRQNACLLFVIALLFSCLSGCRSSELRRSRAEDLILQDDAFKPDAITLDFRVGPGILDVGPIERDLEKAGLVKISLQECRPYNIGHTPGRGYDCGEISLTEKGEEVSKKWKSTPWDNGEGMDYEIPVASRVVKEIIGVSQKPALGASAEFRWGCQPNDLATTYELDFTPPVFMSSGARCPENKEDSQKAQALFKRNDDGWHLEQIRW